jgi:hypothetical protein
MAISDHGLETPTNRRFSLASWQLTIYPRWRPSFIVNRVSLVGPSFSSFRSVTWITMSPAAGSAGLAFVVGHLVEGRCFALASFVFVLYEYLITLDEEV